MPLKRLFYTSVATSLFEERDLSKILDVARMRNSSQQVTGLLLYNNRTFLQMLEGPAGALEQLMAMISNDKRHTEIEVMEYASASERMFPDWSMGYLRPKRDKSRHGVGYLDVLSGVALSLRLLHVPEEVQRILYDFMGLVY